MIRGYSMFINEKIYKYFSIFDKVGLTIGRIRNFSREKLHDFQQIIRNLINIEYNNLTDTTDYFDKGIADNPIVIENDMLKKEIEKLTGKKDIFDKFNITSNPTETTSTTIVPVKKESVKSVKSLESIKEKKQIKSKKTCPEGKELNPKTGRCIKIKTQKEKTQKVRRVEPKKSPNQVLEIVKTSKTCPEGKELNPKTGRCIKIKTTYEKKQKTKTLKQQPKVCPEGKELNPKTGRCIKIKTTDEKKQKTKTLKQQPKVCPEGKEINPKTGRCIKAKTQKVKS
jgi:hypothetical protein